MGLFAECGITLLDRLRLILTPHNAREMLPDRCRVSVQSPDIFASQPNHFIYSEVSEPRALHKRYYHKLSLDPGCNQLLEVDFLIRIGR